MYTGTILLNPKLMPITVNIMVLDYTIWIKKSGHIVATFIYNVPLLTTRTGLHFLSKYNHHPPCWLLFPFTISPSFISITLLHLAATSSTSRDTPLRASKAFRTFNLLFNHGQKLFFMIQSHLSQIIKDKTTAKPLF